MKRAEIRHGTTEENYHCTGQAGEYCGVKNCISDLMCLSSLIKKFIFTKFVYFLCNCDIITLSKLNMKRKQDEY